MKTILITTEFKRIDNRRMPQYVKDFINNPDVSTVHSEVGSRIAAKMAQLEMARNLKKIGIDLEIIRQSAPLLTMEAISKL